MSSGTTLSGMEPSAHASALILGFLYYSQSLASANGMVHSARCLYSCLLLAKVIPAFLGNGVTMTFEYCGKVAVAVAVAVPEKCTWA